jgi:hypothetical protein
MNVDSMKMLDVDGTCKLKLKDEAWRANSAMLPVKDQGPDELKNCKRSISIA